MPKVITSEAELRALIPNVLTSVDGEPTLYEKLLPFLETAEDWVKSTFTSEALFNDLAKSEVTKQTLAKLIATESFMQAIPNLDLILTPNGFGIVSNSNVAPASKERIERLISSLESNRDNIIEHLLNILPSNANWLETDQALFFSATLFPNISLCNKVGITAHRWTEYNRLHSKLLSIGNELANSYFSQEQMTDFRHSVITNFSETPNLVRIVINSIRTLEVSILLDKPLHPQTARDIVNVIRQNPDSFPKWHTSSVAKLFSPELFINKKSAGGFWF